jgi:nitroimidazol reductase NimA-like FMN-containing flavoprotein (pyridoxamine 5'-phosphate oxidase superfamily)
MSPEDHRRLEALSRADCLRLLAEHPARVGRVAAAAERPDILPVNYVLDGGTVVFRTAAGKKLDAAVRGRYVAFQVDTVDAGWRNGWSVLIRGWAEEITDPEELARVRRLPLDSWAPDTQDHYVRITPEIVSGRRLG